MTPVEVSKWPGYRKVQARSLIEILQGWRPKAQAALGFVPIVIVGAIHGTVVQQRLDLDLDLDLDYWKRM